MTAQYNPGGFNPIPGQWDGGIFGGPPQRPAAGQSYTDTQGNVRQWYTPQRPAPTQPFGGLLADPYGSQPQQSAPQGPQQSASPLPWYGQFNWMTGSPWNGPHQQQPTMDQRINHGGGASGSNQAAPANDLASTFRGNFLNPQQFMGSQWNGQQSYYDWVGANQGAGIPSLQNAMTSNRRYYQNWGLDDSSVAPNTNGFTWNHRTGRYEWTPFGGLPVGGEGAAGGAGAGGGGGSAGGGGTMV